MKNIDPILFSIFIMTWMQLLRPIFLLVLICAAWLHAAAQTGAKRSAYATAAACAELWSGAMKNSDGSMTPASVGDMIANVGAVDSDENGEISNSEFMRACKAGLVSDAEQPTELSPSAVSKAPIAPQQAQ